MNRRFPQFNTPAFIFTFLLFIGAATGCGALAPVAEPAEPAEPETALSPETSGSDLSELEALYWARLDSAKMRFTQADVDFMTDMIAHHAQALIMSDLAPVNGASPSVQTLASRIINAQKDEIRTMQRWLRDRGQPVPIVRVEGLDLIITMEEPAMEGEEHGEMDHEGMDHSMHHEGEEHGEMDHEEMDHSMHHEGEEHGEIDHEEMDHSMHHEGEEHEMDHDMDHDMDHGGAAMMHDHSDMVGMLSPAQLIELSEAKGGEFDRLFLSYMIQHHNGAVIMVTDLFDTDGAMQDEAAYKLASDIQVDQRTEIARMQRMLDALPTAPQVEER